MARVEYAIPSVPNESFVYACTNPICHTHFVSRPTAAVNGYFAELHAVDFGQPMVNLVTDKEHPVPEQVSNAQVTLDLHCVSCNNKVGLRLITFDPNSEETVAFELDLLLVNELVVYNGRGGRQPRHMMELDDYDFLQANPQAQVNPQVDEQANPQPDAQANPQPDAQANRDDAYFYISQDTMLASAIFLIFLIVGVILAAFLWRLENK